MVFVKIARKKFKEYLSFGNYEVILIMCVTAAREGGSTELTSVSATTGASLLSYPWLKTEMCLERAGKGMLLP